MLLDAVPRVSGSPLIDDDVRAVHEVMHAKRDTPANLIQRPRGISATEQSGAAEESGRAYAENHRSSQRVQSRVGLHECSCSELNVSQLAGEL